MVMDAAELARWTRFAAKGGIGKCTATCDCVAEAPEDLMFLKDDEIIVLMQLPEPLGLFLGYCEGVVGRFQGSNVHFHSRLKKPVMTKRSSVTASASHAKSPTPTLGLKTPSPMQRGDTSPAVAHDMMIVPHSPESRPVPLASFLSSSRDPVHTEPATATPPLRPDKSDARASLPTEDSTLHVTPALSSSASLFPPAMFTSPSLDLASSTPTASTTGDHIHLPGSSERIAAISAPPNASSTPSSVPLSSLTSGQTSLDEASVYLSVSSQPQSQPTAEFDRLYGSNLPATSKTPETPLDTSTSTAFDAARISLTLSDGEVGIGLSLLQDLADGGNYDDWSDSDSDVGMGSKPSAGDGRAGVVFDQARSRSSQNRHEFGETPSMAARESSGGARSEHSMRSGRTEVSESDQAGLGYEDTEMGHESRGEYGSDIENSVDNDEGDTERIDVQPAPPAPLRAATAPLTSTLTFPPIAPLSPSRSRFYSQSPTQYHFPPPPSHTPVAVATSPKTSSFPARPPSDSTPHTPHKSNSSPVQGGPPPADHHTNGPERERRPSLAPSAASTAYSGSGSADWDGAADIYDDYRYSRFSMRQSTSTSTSARMSGASRISRTSRLSEGVRTHGSAQMPTPFSETLIASRMRRGSDASTPFTASGVRPSIDLRQSMDSRPSGDSYTPYARAPSTSRSNSIIIPNVIPSVTASDLNTQLNARFSGDPSVFPGQDVSLPPNAHHMDVHTPPGLATHRRVASPASESGSNSDASVYTQSSVDRTSVVLAVPAVPDTIGNAPPSAPVTNAPAAPALDSRPHTPPRLTSIRPAPLMLSTPAGADPRSPLLHTTFSSPAPSPGQGSSYTPATGAGDEFTERDGDTAHATPAGMGFFSGVGFGVLSKVLGLGGGSGARLPGVATVASAHPSASPPLSMRDNSTESSLVGVKDVDRNEELGPGQQIAVELDSDDRKSTPGCVNGGGKFETVLHDSPSPEPETSMVQGRLAPLIIANMTPTPSVDGYRSGGDGEVSGNAEDAGQLTEPPSPMVPSLPQTQSHSQEPLSLATTTTAELPVPPHLRPSLSELRGSQPGQGQGQRRSLFLPHPNAPKAPDSHSAGPMYIVQQQTPPPTPQGGSVVQTLRMALAGRSGGRGTTIYGRTASDLAAATGPVPIMFSVDPPSLVGIEPGLTPETGLQGMSPVLGPEPIRPSSVTVGGEKHAAAAEADRASSIEVGAWGERIVSVDQKVNDGVIPRANFFPKVGGVRPRSRSFSGFNSTSTQVLLPIQRSREEGSQPLELTANEVTAYLGPPSPTSSSFGTSASKSTPKLSSLRASSPLSFPHNNRVGVGASRPGLKMPTSPLAQSVLGGMEQPGIVLLPRSSPSVPSSPTAPSTTNHPTHQLRQATSRSTLNESPTTSRPLLARTITPDTSAESVAIVLAQPGQIKEPSHYTASPVLIPHSRPSVDTDAVSVYNNPTISPPTIARQTSLRTKLSLPNMRRNRSRQDESSSLGSGPQGPDGDTVQVRDMDFELVRPNIAQFQSAHAGEESGLHGSEVPINGGPESSDKVLRMETPPISMSLPRSSTAVSDLFTPTSGSWQPSKAPNLPAKSLESEASMDAHRQREQKWMSVMSSVPSSQSKKNKKIKKLLLDGVPSSVRYLVWSHLTDGKARGVPGVYAQLGGRGRVPAFVEIERDVQLCFNNHPQLRSTQGPVLSLLQAYLTMVPDVQYTTGLTLIAGQVLLLAPEEDAFWIFVSIMGTHLRLYFSSNPTQMEVDAALFSRALENNDALVAKKILGEMGVMPSAICYPWFSSLFVGSLPTEYLNRVWDFFLYDGIPFLIRVGLALISCCRRHILESTSEESLLDHLKHPSPSLLPPTVDAFVSLVFSVKLKDDDIRKQRVKMEAQVKRQTQPPRMMSTVGSISLPRSQPLSLAS